MLYIYEIVAARKRTYCSTLTCSFRHSAMEGIPQVIKETITVGQAAEDSKTILSAVVHMDEKTPHMHLAFVPITQDGRLCAKEILGNKKKLTWWQDEFWKHMVDKYPDLERGESASRTGREQ